MVTTPSRMQQRGRTAAQAAAENPVLAAREIFVALGGGVPIVKVGDGVTSYNDLPDLMGPELVADDAAEVDIDTVGDTTTLALLETMGRFVYKHRSGEWYANVMDVYTAGALIQNTLYFTPVVLSAGTINTLAMEITTGVATAIIRPGIYTDDDGLPLNRIAEGANISAASAAVVTSAITAAIPKNGLYWLAYVLQVTTGVSVNQFTRGLTPHLPLGTATPAAGLASPRTRRQLAVTGALPATVGTLETTSASGIGALVYFKYA